MTLVELKVLETGNNIGFGTIFPKSYNLIGFRTIAVRGCAPKSYNLIGLGRYLCVDMFQNPII